MMKILFLSLMAFMISFLGMALGWIFRKKSLKGSCGGFQEVSKWNIECLVCENRQEKNCLPEFSEENSSSS